MMETGSRFARFGKMFMKVYLPDSSD